MRAKLINGALIYAPRKIEREIDGKQYITYNPTDEMLADAGWSTVRYTNPPEAPEGWHCKPVYTEFGDEIIQGWELELDEITEETALVRYANEVTGADDPDLISAAETMLKQLTEV